MFITKTTSNREPKQMDVYDEIDKGGKVRLEYRTSNT